MARRYEDLDSDEYRLPDGMQRIGYDADSETYTFRDASDGTLWESEPGSRHGRLYRKGVGRMTMTGEEEAHLTRNKREDWRYMAPFFLLVILFLLLVWRFVGPPLFAGSTLNCSEKAKVYTVAEGDTCWDIAQREESTVQDLKAVNKGLNCESLRAGIDICVPVSEGSGQPK